MHQCLGIPEILELIFRQVADASRGDTLHLVLTCRHFKDHALGLLWHSLGSPAPLIMAMPSDLWKVNKGRSLQRDFLIFVRRIVPEDWESFDKYAQYVKEIGIGDTFHRWGAFHVSRTVYDELSKRRCRPLLPNLARVHLASHWDIDLNMVPMFLTERVTYLGMDDYRRNRRTRRGKDLRAWSAMAVQAPLIESVALKGHHSRISRHKMEATCLGNFISGLQHLKYFESTYLRLPDETIRHVTSLPSLRTLIIPIKDFRDLARICDPKSNPSYRPQLCSLQTLHLLCDSLSPGSCSTVLEFMNPTCLRGLHISSFYGNLSPGELESLFVALRDHCDPPSFEAVYFSVHDLLDLIDTDWDDHHDRDPPLEESIDLPPSIIPFRVLKPFLSDYSSLKFIVLPLHLLDADDDEIEQIASCLPMLHRFDLASDPCDQILRSRMTLRSVLSFVTHCRYLFELSLYVDATLPSWPTPEALSPLVHPNLKRLSLGRSTVTPEAWGKARDLLDHLLPNADEIILKTDYPNSDEDSSSYFDPDEDDSEFGDYDDSYGFEDSEEDDFGEDDDEDEEEDDHDHDSDSDQAEDDFT